MTLTAEAIERGARALAIALHGGDWDTPHKAMGEPSGNYTEAQKQWWRDGVRKMMEKTT